MKKYIRPEAEYIEFYSEETITYEGSNVGVGAYDTENEGFWGENVD